MFQSEHENGNIVGLNIVTGEPMDPQLEGVYDNYSVMRQMINSAYVLRPCANFQNPSHLVIFGLFQTHHCVTTPPC